MELGEIRTSPVEARRRWNHTGIQLTAGHRYLLSATGTWTDWNTTCGPDGHPGDKLLFRVTRRMKRARRLPWFALVGALDEDPDTHFLIGTAAEFTPQRDGELTCFASDVSFMYWNNSGELALTVKRIG